MALADFPVAILLAGSFARIASSADIALVSKLLGHALIAITADVDGLLIGTVVSDTVDGAATLIARCTPGCEHLMKARGLGQKPSEEGTSDPGA